MTDPLMAGEAEEVASVMHELVNVRVVAEHRQGALIDADEVIEEHRQTTAPISHLAPPESGIATGRAGCRSGVRIAVM